MAKIKSKGTLLKADLGSTVFVTVSQVISLDLPDTESETFESDTLDNTDAGIPYDPTGRTEGGSLGFEAFYDPDVSNGCNHEDLFALLTTPAKQTYQIVFADTDSSEWDFEGAGLSIGGTVALNDGVKISCSIKLDGIPTYPTAA